MDVALSNVDLDKFIKEVETNGLNMRTAKDIKPTTDIDDLFDNSGHVIYFHDNNDGSGVGHWITLLRTRNKEYAFIDSFGKSPDYYNKDIMKMMKYNKDKVKSLEINKKKLQGDESMVCGKYSIILTALNKKGMKPEDMVNYLKDGGKKEKSVDKFIVKLFGE